MRHSDFLITLSLHTFQTMNSISSNKLSLKYQIFTPSHCKDIGIRQFVFVAKTQIFTQLPMKPSKLLKGIYRFKYSSLSNTKNFLSLKPSVYYRLPFFRKYDEIKRKRIILYIVTDFITVCSVQAAVCRQLFLYLKFHFSLPWCFLDFILPYESLSLNSLFTVINLTS